MEDKQVIEVNAGDQVLHFAVDDAAINQYLNDQMPNEKVKSAYNMLSRAVTDEDRDAFRSIALRGETPRGIVVIQIATIVASEFGGDLEISIKKPNGGSPE